MVQGESASRPRGLNPNHNPGQASDPQGSSLLLVFGFGRGPRGVVRFGVKASLCGLNRVRKVRKSGGQFTVGAKCDKGAGMICGQIFFVGPAAEIDNIGFHPPLLLGRLGGSHRNKAGCEPNGMA